MSTTPEGSARRGRRRPDMQAQMESELQFDPMTEEIRSGETPAMDSEPTVRFLYDGAVVTANATLAVDLGDGKTNFFKYGATDRVQPHESAEDIYGRLVTVVNEGVINMIDDVSDRLDAYAAERERRHSQIPG